MVNALSILLKALALLLWRESLHAAVGLWAVSMALDCATLRGRRTAAPAVRGWMSAAADAALLSAASLVAGVAALELGQLAAMTWKGGLAWVAQGAAWLLRGCGLPTGAQDGTLHLSTMAGPLRFTASWDGLALLVPLCVLLLVAASSLFRSTSWRQVWRELLRATAALWAVTLVRFALWVLLFNAFTEFISYETDELPISPFVKPLPVTLSFLPFLLAISRWLAPAVETAPATAASAAPPSAASAAPPSAPATGARAGRPAPFGQPLRIALWAAFTALTAFALLEPVGTPKPGRVLIDGHYARWSPAGRPYDREWYGADSGYNYAVLRDWLDRFFTTKMLESPISPARLAEADVLILFAPDRAFGAAERQAIQHFVQNGGGLLMVGDHTNVFGSSSNLNALCDDFGLLFRDDVLFDFDDDFFQMYHPPRPAHRLLHGIDFMKLRGPGSIRTGSWRAAPYMQIGHSKGLRAIYSVNNFYPPPHDDPRMTTGTFCFAAASRVGAGRVVAFADSTVFSNFEIFYPGKYEWLLNTTHWLNHRDARWRQAARTAAALAALAVLVVLLAPRPRPRAALWTLVLAAVVFGTARLATRTAAAASASFPPLRRPAQGLFFLSEPDDPSYILRDFTSTEPFDQRYDVFVQWVLRTGRFSGFRLVPEGKGDALYRHLRTSPDADAALGLIVRNAAQLPLLAAVGRDPAVQRVLLLFSRTIDRAQIEQSMLDAGLVRNDAELAPAWTAWPEGEVLLDAGGRRMLLVFDAERFSDQHMGVTEKVVPNDALRVRYDAAFRLFDTLFDVPAP